MGSHTWWEDLPKVKWPDLPPSVTTRGNWYQQNMHNARWKGKLLDLAILVLAAGVPFAVAIKADNWVVALLGSLATRVEEIAAEETGTWAQRLPRSATPDTKP